MAAKIPRGATLVGPFDGNAKPVRSGLYLRVSQATGQKVWAYFSTKTRAWGLYADSPARALERKNKRSKKRLSWFGTTQAPSFRPVG